MVCRPRALTNSLVHGDQVWDEEFFMWKDDLDLCLRIRRAGWVVMYLPHLKAYHCRGWSPERKKMPKWHRVLSVRNDIRVCMRARSPYLLYALAKYFYVKVIERP